MMALALGGGADTVGEGERRFEVGKGEDALQTADAFALDDSPLGNLAHQRGRFAGGHRRRSGLARRASLVGQCSHARITPPLAAARNAGIVDT